MAQLLSYCLLPPFTTKYKGLKIAKSLDNTVKMVYKWLDSHL